MLGLCFFSVKYGIFNYCSLPYILINDQTALTGKVRSFYNQINHNYSFHTFLLHLWVENNQINSLFSFLIGVFTLCQPFPVVRPRTYRDFITTCKTCTWMHLKNRNNHHGSSTRFKIHGDRRVVFLIKAAFIIFTRACKLT